MNTINFYKEGGFNPSSLFYTDGYKIGHCLMLAPDVDFLYGQLIPRSFKHLPGINRCLSIGQQFTWIWIHDQFQIGFFSQPLQKALSFIKDMCLYLGMTYNGDHFIKLYELGYLPSRVKSLPEGITIKNNIPLMTFKNTKKGFAWLTLFLETICSSVNWQIPTVATKAMYFRKNINEGLLKTDPENMALGTFLGHDFAARGLDPYSMAASGIAWASCFHGSDELITIPAARYYYNESEEEMSIFSVNASEHSVSCTNIFYFLKELKEGNLNHEIEKYYSFDLPCDGNLDNPDYLAIAEWLMLKRWLILFPEGILSYVSDTFNTWKAITHIIARSKEEILARKGKLVVRGDSGDPADIVCGKFSITNYNSDKFWDLYSKRMNFEFVNNNIFYKFDGDHLSELFSEYGEEVNYITQTIEDLLKNNVISKLEKQPNISEQKGIIELLWDIFGGDITSTGYKRLHPCIGAIYGDGINFETQENIYSRLISKKFATSNIVLGAGSFFQRYNTRDSLGLSYLNC